MGDTKRLRKKYTTPMHPWNATRITLERNIMRKYGVANKREIWKMESVLKGFKDQTKNLLTRTDVQAGRERKQMHDRMVRLGLIAKEAGDDDILGLQLKDIMNRRLQTIVLRKKMARSIKHARQLITHEHIVVGGKKITSPSYLVLFEEEATIGYAADSPYLKGEHPEAFDEEVHRRKLERQKAKARRQGVKMDEIVVFDPVDIEDPDERKAVDYDASVADLGSVEEEGPEEAVAEGSAEAKE